MHDPAARGPGWAGRDRFDPQPPAGTPVAVIEVPAGGSAPPRGATRSDRRWGVTPALARLLAANALFAYVLLALVLPSPWGAVVPLAVLVQLAAIRHGVTRAVGTTVMGFVGGAVVAVMRLGQGQPLEPRRLAIAGALVGAMVIAGWPVRRGGRSR